MSIGRLEMGKLLMGLHRASKELQGFSALRMSLVLSNQTSSTLPLKKS